MRKRMLIAVLLLTGCMTVGRAQDLPSVDTGNVPDAMSIPGVPTAPGLAPEPIGGSPAGMVLSSPTAAVQSLGMDGQVTSGVTSSIDLRSDGLAQSSEGGRSGPQSSLTSAWKVSGFGAQAAANSPVNARYGGPLYSRSGQSSGGASTYSSEMVGSSNLYMYPAGRQWQANGSAGRPTQEQGESVKGLYPLETSRSMRSLYPAGSSNLTSDIPDLAAAAGSPAQGLNGSPAAMLPGFAPGAESSIQTPGPAFSYTPPVLRPRVTRGTRLERHTFSTLRERRHTLSSGLTTRRLRTLPRREHNYR